MVVEFNFAITRSTQFSSLFQSQTTMSSILSLHGQGLKLNTRDDIQPHLANIDPANVAEIHLGGNTLGVEAAEALGEFLAKATSLKVTPHLYTTNDMLIALKVADFADIFTGRLITEIPLALTSIFNALLSHPNPLLHTLNLSDNAFGGRSVDPFIPFLSTTTSLTTLRLNNNGLGPEGGKAIAEAIKANAAHRKKSPSSAVLQTVICGRNRLEDGSAGAWAEAFRAHGGLVEVRMPQNGIRPDGIVALAEGLKECKGLQTIDLQDNTFCAKGEQAWAEALESWPDLQEANFSDCVLREEDEEQVPQVLKKLAGGSNPMLTTLKLQNNNLEAAAIQVLADGISKLPALKRLEIQANEFDAEEDEELVSGLREALSGREGVLIATDEDEEEDDARQAEAAEAPKTRAAAVTQPPAEVTVPAPVQALPGVVAPESVPGPAVVPAAASEPQPMEIVQPEPVRVEEPKVEEAKPAEVIPQVIEPTKVEEPKPAEEPSPGIDL